jgi:hemolysin activation/secretion protein
VAAMVRLCAVVLACAVSSAWAQAPGTPVEESPRFDIRRFVVEGNTLVSDEELAKRVAPFVGEKKSFADVQLAQDALQEAYRAEGWGAVQVILPEQELVDGVIRFRVIEGKLDKIDIRATPFHDAENVRDSLPSLRRGQTPSLLRLGRDLSIANENPSKRTTVTLSAGERDDAVDAMVSLEDSKPLKYYVTVDNSGDKQTGESRMGIGFQHANLWNRDHVLTAQYLTSPENVDDVTILGLGYHVPLYGRNASLDFLLGYSDVDSGTVQNLFNVTGKGYLALARYNMYLKRLGEGYEQRLSFGLDYRAYDSEVVLTGTAGSLVPDYTVHPASLTYSGVWRGAETNASVYASVMQNIPGGNDGEEGDFAGNNFGGRFGATDDYNLVRLGGQLSTAFGEGYLARAVFNAQYTGDALVAAEQFGLGGIDSVRGFRQRILANDRGYQGSLEAYTSDFGKKLGPEKLWLRGLAFYDFGGLRRVKALEGEDVDQFLSSWGLGIQGGYLGVSFRLYYADVINTGDVPSASIERWQGSLVWIF